MRDPAKHKYEPYVYYNALLGGEKPAFYADFPEEGFYILKRGAVLVPVAIYYSEDASGEPDEFIMTIDGAVVPESDYLKTWRSCATKALAWDIHQSYVENGCWPGESTPAPMGDNAPPTEVEDLLPIEIEKHEAWLRTVGNLTSKAKADEAANRIDGLRKLVLAASKKHKAEKEPHLRAGQAVDQKYNPKIKAAESVVYRLEQAIKAFDRAERQKREQEEAAQRKAQEAIDAAAAKEAAKQAVTDKPPILDGGFDLVAPVVDLPPPKPQPMSYGTPGIARAVKIKITYQAVIEDQDAVYAQCRDEPEVKAALQKIAQRWIDAGHTMRGVSKQEAA